MLDHSIHRMRYSVDNCASCSEVVSGMTPDMPPSGSVAAIEVICLAKMLTIVFRCAFIADTLERQ